MGTATRLSPEADQRQLHAVLAAVDGMPDSVLLSVGKSFTDRIADPSSGTPEQGLAAVVALAQTTDPMAKIGELLRRVVSYRQMVGAEVPDPS